VTALLNETDARRELGHIGKTKLYELTSAGELKSVKIGRRRMWESDSILGYVKRITEDPPCVAMPRVLPRPTPSRIRSLREAQALTPEVLASTVGTTTGTISDWESGRQRPNRASVEKLAVALRVSVPTLCTMQADRS
jgi:DNA-binding transcriptional regulator YiaG